MEEYSQLWLLFITLLQPLSHSIRKKRKVIATEQLKIAKYRTTLQNYSYLTFYWGPDAYGLPDSTFEGMQ